MTYPTDVAEETIAKVSTAPRITADDILRKVKAVHYINVGDAVVATDAGTVTDSEKLLTICIITLENGFTVTGESARASPANFNKEIGQDIAYKHAIDKIWLLEGYLLKQKLFDAE